MSRFTVERWYYCAECGVLVAGGRERCVLLCCNCMHYPGWQHDPTLHRAIVCKRCNPCTGTWLDVPMPAFLRRLTAAHPKKGVVV